MENKRFILVISPRFDKEIYNPISLVFIQNFGKKNDENDQEFQLEYYSQGEQKDDYIMQINLTKDDKGHLILLTIND